MLTVIDRLENMAGDWHEFESKALRKEKDREARREKEKEKEKEKRKASAALLQEGDRETKRLRQDGDSAQEP
jgi:CTD kinase subunit alpha